MTPKDDVNQKQMQQRQPDREGEESGLEKAVNRAEDMVGGMVGMASAATSGSSDPDAFVTNAAIGDLYEREAASMALERSQSELVRNLALMMLDDHMTSTHQLKSTLRSMDSAPQPPTELDDRRQKMIDHLQQASDEDFDKLYLEQQRMSHRETIKLFNGFAGDGKDPGLRLFARATAPGLERHLDMVEAVDDKLKSSR